jgi:hypothetical protein
MSKRFSETEIWNEDWFLEMPNEYKLFWFYMLSKCDHAGVFKVNLRSFRGLLEVNLTTDKALTYFNTNKQRVRVISDSIWYVEDFFVFQYGTTLNLNSRMHESISEILKKHNIDLTSIRGLKDLKDRVKDKDKDKDKDKVLKGGMGENTEGVCYDIEAYLMAHQKDFEVACMNSKKDSEEVKALLKNYHLWNVQNEIYPKKPLPLIAGFQRWILNEKNFKKNGTHAKQTSTVGKTIEFD